VDNRQCISSYQHCHRYWGCSDSSDEVKRGKLRIVFWQYISLIPIYLLTLQVKLFRKPLVMSVLLNVHVAYRWKGGFYSYIQLVYRLYSVDAVMSLLI